MVTLNAAAKNWAALATLRVLLGCFESAIAPALILVTSMWYKKSEQPARVGFWYVGTGTGTIIGALTSFGFQHYESDVFTPWQIMFLIFGLITIVVGILVVFYLPDSPMKSRLTREEKIWAIERLRENQTGIENKHFKFAQFKECFSDPQTWLIAFITVTANIPNGAVSSFQATIIKGFGYTSKETALLSIPSGVVACIAVISGGLSSSRFNVRGPIICILLLIGGILGGSLLAFSNSSNKGALLTGNYLTNVIGAALPLLYSYSAANYAGHTKKVTMNAVVLMSFCLGNIIGPLTFREADKPQYLPAKAVIVGSTAAAILATCVLMAYYVWENKRRDHLHLGVGHKENSEFFDLTDRENKEFRVSLLLYCIYIAFIVQNGIDLFTNLCFIVPMVGVMCRTVTKRGDWTYIGQRQYGRLSNRPQNSYTKYIDCLKRFVASHIRWCVKKHIVTYAAMPCLSDILALKSINVSSNQTISLPAERLNTV